MPDRRAQRCRSLPAAGSPQIPAQEHHRPSAIIPTASESPQFPARESPSAARFTSGDGGSLVCVWLAPYRGRADAVYAHAARSKRHLLVHRSSFGSSRNSSETGQRSWPVSVVCGRAKQDARARPHRFQQRQRIIRSRSHPSSLAIGQTRQRLGGTADQSSRIACACTAAGTSP